MKTISLSLLALLLLCGLAMILGTMFDYGKNSFPELGGSSFKVSRVNCNSVTATTSAAYRLGATASTTCAGIDISNADEVYLSFMLTATVTPAVLYFEPQFSVDSSDTARNYFTVNGGLSGGTIATTSSLTGNKDQYRTYKIANVVGKYMRVVYDTTNAAKVYLEVIKKESN